MNRRQLLDALQLDDHHIFHDQIESIPAIQPMPTKHNRKINLSPKT